MEVMVVSDLGIDLIVDSVASSEGVISQGYHPALVMVMKAPSTRVRLWSFQILSSEEMACMGPCLLSLYLSSGGLRVLMFLTLISIVHIWRRGG